MSQALIQDWTESQVLLNMGRQRTVKYRVFRNGNRAFQQISETDNTPIHTLELPEGMKLDRSSYEVLLRYVLTDVVAA